MRFTIFINKIFKNLTIKFLPIFLININSCLIYRRFFFKIINTFLKIEYFILIITIRKKLLFL